MELIDRLVEKTLAAIGSRRRPMESTYRLQFHAGFTFRDAERITSYLHELGITHCYASPYLKARSGSTHGYDIVDHSSLNPEIGNEEDYIAWVRATHAQGMGHILDMVPNHMGVGTNDNPWWNDVLENGPASRYAGYFDIAWDASLRLELRGKVLLPTLGEPYGDVLESGQLQIVFSEGAFAIAYFDRRFPLAPCSYSKILDYRFSELESALGSENPGLLEYQSILTACRNLPGSTVTDSAKVLERFREKEVIKRRLAVLASENTEVRTFINENLVRMNGTSGDSHSFDLLEDLLESQCYRLSYWRVAPDEINYRRFFDINDLAAINIEREDVFIATHALVTKLLVDGSVDGLRIDHPDGLYDPQQYFARLQTHFLLSSAKSLASADTEFSGIDWNEIESPLTTRFIAALEERKASSRWPLFVVAEKILGVKESLPDDWAVDGTSGYEFINMTNGLFVETASEAKFTSLYEELVQDDTRYSELVYRKKLLILQVSLASELHMLVRQLDGLAQKSRRSRDFTFNALRKALREIIACFPVYRSYIANNGVNDLDRRQVELAIRRASTRNPLLSRRLFRFIRGMLLLEYPETFAEEARAEQRQFTGKFQEVTSPVMAKGVEDTAFYIYNRLTSLNEVGGDPDRFGVGSDALHKAYADRQAKWPFALSPLSTHDTKRSEDVRARLNVLSEMPSEWQAAVTRWTRMNSPHRHSVDEFLIPDLNEEYFLYQALTGAWPLEPYSRDEYAEFVKRIQNYMEKSLHEAKVHSSWINPNEDYDREISGFVARILDADSNRPFLDDFRTFQQRISHFGSFNSLAQTLLKITAPGIPDTYQGTELWDFSLVDPDNRRPVDYEKRERVLKELQASASANSDLRNLVAELLSRKEDGRIKLYLSYRAFCCRRDHPGLFSTGKYVPLAVSRENAAHLFAFARVNEEHQAIVAVPRLLTGLAPDVEKPPLGPDCWRDTRIMLPEIDSGLIWRNIFTGQDLVVEEKVGERYLLAASLFAHFPVALLLGQRT